MFHIEKSTRPDRCELCRYSISTTVIVSRPHAAMQDMYQSEERRVCKRFPPTAREDGQGISPYVSDGNWCGEFKEKQP